MKTANVPGQRTFSRFAAPFFLEIRQDSCEKMSCPPGKFLAAGHISSFQIHTKKEIMIFSQNLVDPQEVLCYYDYTCEKGSYFFAPIFNPRDTR